MLIPKHFCFRKQLLDALFEDRLLQDAINALIHDGFNLDRHIVRSQEAYVRLPLGTAFFKEGANQLNRLEPIAYRHVDVHEDEFVGGARFHKPVLY